MKDYNTKYNSRRSDSKKYPAELLDRLPACGNTWLILRAMDVSGRGIVEIGSSAIADSLSTSVGTIRNHITQGKKLGLYRAVKHLGGQVYRFYLCNAIAVCWSLGVERTNSVVWIGPTEICRRKIIATEAVAKVLQDRSAWRAYEGQKKRIRTKLENFVDASVPCRGPLLHRGSRYAFIRDSVPVYGASQEGIGKMLERSKATVTRRLRNTKKVQIAQLQKEWSPSELGEAKEFLYFDSELLKCFSSCNRVFKVFPNVYPSLPHPCRTGRWSRRLTTRAKEQVSLS